MTRAGRDDTAGDGSQFADIVENSVDRMRREIENLRFVGQGVQDEGDFVTGWRADLT